MGEGYSIKRMKREAEARILVTAVPYDGLEEVRCPEPCGKMLGRFSGSGIIVCPRCGNVVRWHNVGI
jgi:hypothetical protein